MRPPDPPDRRKSESPRGGGLPGDTGQQKEAHRNRGHVVFQGRGNGRHRNQHAPDWGRPRGADAAADLEAAFVGGAVKRFAVVISKSGGREVLFSRYSTKAEAREAAKLLAWAGSPARVVEAAS